MGGNEKERSDEVREEESRVMGKPMLVLDASEREGASAKRRTGKTTACMPWLR
jgi:hypothetical protein